jgi:hypothetical protein
MIALSLVIDSLDVRTLDRSLFRLSIIRALKFIFIDLVYKLLILWVSIIINGHVVDRRLSIHLILVNQVRTIRLLNWIELFLVKGRLHHLIRHHLMHWLRLIKIHGIRSIPLHIHGVSLTYLLKRLLECIIAETTESRVLKLRHYGLLGIKGRSCNIIVVLQGVCDHLLLLMLLPLKVWMIIFYNNLLLENKKFTKFISERLFQRKWLSQNFWVPLSSIILVLLAYKWN